MALEAATPPRRDLAYFRSESTPFSIGVMILGATSLTLALLGSIVVLTAQGLTPHESLIQGIRSAEFRNTNFVAVVAAISSMVLGWGMYRRMPTKVSREQLIAGAVLGAQALVLGSLALWFSESDVETFALNFLRFEVLPDAIPGFISGAKNTLILALSGEFFGVILGLIFAVFAISKRSVVRAPARIYINFFRGTPLVWQIIFIGVAIPLALQKAIPVYIAGIIALSFNAGAYSAEVFRAGIQSIERGQLEAARSLGMSYMQAMRYAVVPQAIRRVIPPLMNEFVILIKDTSLLIVLGLTTRQFELMTFGNNRLENTANATYLIGTAIGYLAISLPSIRLVNFLERKLRSGLVGVGA